MKPAAKKTWQAPRPFRHPSKALALCLGVFIFLYCLDSLVGRESDSTGEHTDQANLDGSSAAAGAKASDKQSFKTKSNQQTYEVTPIDTDLIDRICKPKDKEDRAKYRVILRTKRVAPSARRQMYEGFPSYQYAPVTTKSLRDAKFSASEALLEENSALASGCWVFTDVPRIVQPEPPILQPSQVMFGVASSKDRLLVPHAVTSHWLGNSSTNFYVHVPAADVPEAEMMIHDHYKSFGLSGVFVERETVEVEQTMQYARLSAAMYELTVKKGMKDVLWYVHMDDDTLLTSVTDYLRMLDSYDASKPLYIGSHSESTVALARDGRGAWGGASIAISRALAEQLSKRWLECKDEGRLDHTEFGDHKLDACVAYLQGRTKKQPDMQLENTLHQLDFFGSIDGYLRSGVKWLTMHHFGWVNLFPYPDGPGGTPAKVQKIVNSARVLGADGLFSNFLLKHDESGSTVLTNGYAITHYMVPMTKLELESVERTYMQDRPNDFEAALGPTRLPKAEGTEKRSYFVHQVVPRIVDGKNIGSTWTYRHDRDGVQEDVLVDWLL